MPSPTSVHFLRTKCLTELQVTFFIFVHLPRIHFVHCVQRTALDSTLFPHIPQESILLKIFSPSVPLTIILVFPTFTFNPLSSSALPHLWNLFLTSSNFHSSAPDHPRTKFHSIILLLHVLSQHQPQKQNISDDSTDP